MIKMALIDFKCKDCGKEFFEIINGQGEKPVCPECKSKNIERVYKGKFYGKGAGCAGSCSGCSGCH
jgi:putative FmdB family regulatory protein